MKKKLSVIIPVLFTITMFVLFYFKRYFVIKFYPPVMNFIIFITFFSSLFAEETVIQKFAHLMAGNKYNSIIANYTKKLTYVWVCFTFVNFIVSIVTIFMSDKIWLLYNTCISYVLIGLIFIIEYPIRLLYRRCHNI